MPPAKVPTRKVDSESDNIKSDNVTKANIAMELNVETTKAKKSKKAKDEEKIPKRRGRKPKKMLDQPSKPIDFDLLEKQDDAIITLHLPIDLNKNVKNVKNVENVENAAKTTATSSVYESDSSEEDIFGKNDTSDEKPCSSCIERDQINKYLKQKIAQMELELKREKRERKAYYTNVNMFDIKDGKPILAQKTTVSCMWDCHVFDTTPCFLPELYYQNNYYVRAICFCSFNCALAYNIYQLNDSKVSERKSLILSICRKIYQTDDIEINEAPPRECLAKFGGKKTIEDFRSDSKTMNKKYMVLLPPIQPLFPIIQEDCRDAVPNDYPSQDKSKFSLQRNTPLVKNNSLVSSMGLTIKNNKK